MTKEEAVARAIRDANIKWWSENGALRTPPNVILGSAAIAAADAWEREQGERVGLSACLVGVAANAPCQPDDTLKRCTCLREIANAAKAGPWWTDGRYDGSEMGCAIIAARTDSGPLPGNPTRGMVAFVTAILNTEARQCEATAKHIATFDPPTVLALIEQIAALRAENARLSDDARIAFAAPPSTRQRHDRA